MRVVPSIKQLVQVRYGLVDTVIFPRLHMLRSPARFQCVQGGISGGVHAALSGRPAGRRGVAIFGEFCGGRVVGRARFRETMGDPKWRVN